RTVFPEIAGRIDYCDSAYDAARGTHAVLLMTEWEEFRKLDLRRLRDAMEVPIMLDGRNLYDPKQARESGFEYVCMGRSTAGSLPTGRQRKAVSAGRPGVRGVLV